MKKIYYLPLALVLFLIVTNPSIKVFREYLGSPTLTGLKRTSNFFICSKFESAYGQRYFAMIGNFFYLKSEPFIRLPVDTLVDSAKVDSSKMTDTVKDSLHILVK